MGDQNPPIPYVASAVPACELSLGSAHGDDARNHGLGVSAVHLQVLGSPAVAAGRELPPHSNGTMGLPAGCRR